MPPVTPQLGLPQQQPALALQLQAMWQQQMQQVQLQQIQQQQIQQFAAAAAAGLFSGRSFFPPAMHPMMGGLPPLSMPSAFPLGTPDLPAFYAAAAAAAAAAAGAANAAGASAPNPLYNTTSGAPLPVPAASFSASMTQPPMSELQQPTDQTPNGSTPSGSTGAVVRAGQARLADDTELPSAKRARRNKEPDMRYRHRSRAKSKRYREQKKEHLAELMSRTRELHEFAAGRHKVAVALFADLRDTLAAMDACDSCAVRCSPSAPGSDEHPLPQQQTSSSGGFPLVPTEEEERSNEDKDGKAEEPDKAKGGKESEDAEEHERTGGSASSDTGSHSGSSNAAPAAPSSARSSTRSASRSASPANSGDGSQGDGSQGSGSGGRGSTSGSGVRSGSSESGSASAAGSRSTGASSCAAVASAGDGVAGVAGVDAGLNAHSSAEQSRTGTSSTPFQAMFSSHSSATSFSAPIKGGQLITAAADLTRLVETCFADFQGYMAAHGAQVSKAFERPFERPSTLAQDDSNSASRSSAPVESPTPDLERKRVHSRVYRHNKKLELDAWTHRQEQLCRLLVETQLPLLEHLQVAVASLCVRHRSCREKHASFVEPKGLGSEDGDAADREPLIQFARSLLGRGMSVHSAISLSSPSDDVFDAPNGGAGAAQAAGGDEDS